MCTLRLLAAAACLLPPLACGKSNFEVNPPPLGPLVAYSQAGNTRWQWSAQKAALVESPATGDLPAYDYQSNRWVQGGEPVSGPGVSVNEEQVKARLRTASLPPDQKAAGVTCVGTGGALCFGAVCTMAGESAKGYFLRVCDQKNQTTGACKNYRVEGGSLNKCPVWFYGSPTAGK